MLNMLGFYEVYRHDKGKHYEWLTREQAEELKKQGYTVFVEPLWRENA